MKKNSNPWLPWIETIKLPPSPDRGNILVIIPTSGDDTICLKRCLTSLYCAVEWKGIHLVIVLCPANKEKEKRIKEVCGKYATVISLPGPFNYCRSINKGLSQKRPDDGYVLFLNDDVTFTKKGDLLLLKKTLREKRWACVGPRYSSIKFNCPEVSLTGVSTLFWA